MKNKFTVLEIPWPGDACIICLKPGELSLEHVIPKSLHGGLVCRFICSNCNSSFGHTIDAGARFDPAIRTAARAVEPSIPKLVADFEEGQRYLIHTDAAMTWSIKRSDEFHGSWQKLPDGSSIAPEDQAIASLRGRMRAEGLCNAEIDRAIARYMAAEPGKIVDMSSRWAAKKLTAHLAGPDLRAASVETMLFVKIAYEFAALLVGQAIYSNTPQLVEIRGVLQNKQPDSDAFDIEILMAEEAAPFHGIAFEGNSPHATFQVRLFGKLAYRVHLKRLAIDHKPIAYTHDLKSGEHWHNYD